MSASVAQRQLLTVRETAKRLYLSERSVWRMIADGRLPAIRLGGPGSPVRIDRDELNAWLYAEET
jgi:excisionase family DNA binding protein